MLGCFGGVNPRMTTKWQCKRCRAARNPTGLCPACRCPEFDIIMSYDIGDRVAVASSLGERGGVVHAVSHHADPREALYAIRMDDGGFWQAKYEELRHIISNL